MAEDNHNLKTGSTPATVRSQNMAAALSSYARALTFENKSRRNFYRLAGLKPRQRDRFFSAAIILAGIFAFVLPVFGSIVYFIFIATPQYTSEVRFVVRSSVPLLSRDRYSSESVEPKAKIVQDTAVLLNYLSSPALVQILDKEADFQRLFGRSEIDLIARLKSSPTQEELVKYWEGRYSASVNPRSGIVELEVTAFSPQEANDLLKRVVKATEDQVNKLNANMWNNLRLSVQKDVDETTRDLTALRDKYRETQNQTGVYNIGTAATSIMTVLTALETETAALRSRRDALSQSVAANSPNLVDLNRRIEAQENQAALLKETIAGTRNQNGNFADYSQLFSQLDLELKMAEGRLRSAISEQEKVNLVSSLQLLYVDTFTEPTIPDYSKYPRRLVGIAVSIIAALAAFGVVFGCIVILRRKFD
ncbi:capsular polysaccharide transport system permease protein [Neorhizobium sp. 2083]|uniref:hypothetical protein n=1 Tax=Neorhizobium sp. 2083 TaxID=2817762 RepID=UPI00285F372F|nr:hypothetical protein [Neorhizobium sp. 2083]MDR6818098.1 capsular polysaccharide transport system permease protein [Neorhizobium sp. 2083]